MREGEAMNRTTEAVAGSGAKVLGAARDRDWHECGLEEKVERLRQVFLHVESQLETATKRGSEALKIAKTHQHSERGMVMTPVFSEFPEFISGEALSDSPRTLRHIFHRLR